MDRRLFSAAFLLIAAIGLSASLPAQAQSCYVTRSGGDFSYKGGTYKFVGVNLRGITFHSTPEMDAQITSARDMGVRVVRIFGAKSNLNSTQVGDNIAAFLGRVSAIAPNMKVIISLTDFYYSSYYPDGAHLIVQGDDGWYSGGLLTSGWFSSGYNTNYKPFVQALVTRFKTDDRIFAWELGNELQAGNATDMLNFAYTMGWNIRNWGAQQMVSTGFLDVNHAIKGGVNNTIISQMYVGPWSGWGSSPFSFGSIHAYNNEQVSGNNPYQLQDWDINWFINNNYPYIVGEGGFNASNGGCWPYNVFPGGSWDGVSIPAASGTGGRSGAVSATINRFYDVKGADGYMQWGFMNGSADNGEGDPCSGMDSVWHSDWSALWNTYSPRATSLPAGGSASCGGGSCIASVASTSWKGEYFPNTTLSGSPTLVRDDGTGTINFNWGSGGPSTCSIGVDNFSARWTRTVYFNAGTWRFSTTTDDGVRLYVDGVLRINYWIDQGPTTYTADVYLGAGNHTLVMEYYERGGGAVAQLSWSSVGVSGNSAEVLTDSVVPGVMSPGETRNVRVRMRNNGTTTWTTDVYRLGASGSNRVTWGGWPCGGYVNSVTDSRVYLCSAVGSGGVYDFNFTIRAPNDGSTSTVFSAQMVQEGVQWFGQTGTWNITVSGQSCASACSQCILNARPDILPFYQQNGWDTSCGNWNNIVNNWCSGLDPTACNNLKAGQCNPACR